MIKNISHLSNKFIYLLKLISAIVIIISTVLFVKYSRQVSSSIISSIESCINIIIPSLFSFMVLCNIIVGSNIYILISRPFYLISKYILKIPTELFSVFILSCVGGYPVGAKLLTILIDNGKITKSQAARLMCFCYCNSPAFFAGAVGLVIFDNVSTGILIYTAIVISNFLLAILTGMTCPVPKSKATKTDIVLNPKLIVDSAASAAKTVFLICTMLIFFSGIIAIIELVGILTLVAGSISSFTGIDLPSLKGIISALIEISRVSLLPQNCYNMAPVIAALGAFGGICVILQIIGISSGKISLKYFFATRPIHMMISAITAKILFSTFYDNFAITTSVRSTPSFIVKINPLISVICLSLMTILLIFKKN